MNERIRELAEQSTTYIEPTFSSGEGWIFDKEKFAELIVRECVDTAFHRGHPDLEFLLKHFGVEE
jgi:hypothetical protein